MIKKEGLHLYVNIKNYIEIIEKEETQEGQLKHSIHALSHFFTSIESFALKHNKTLDVNIEKITESRLHMFIVGDVIKTSLLAIDIVCFANHLAIVINKSVSKYNKLEDFQINCGAAYGGFYYYSFEHANIKEETSFGFPCNYAAKIQNDVANRQFAVDKNIYDLLEEKYKKIFIHTVSNRLVIDGEKASYYCADLATLESVNLNGNGYIDNEVKCAVEEIIEDNLSDIKKIDFVNEQSLLGIKNEEYTTLKGIPFFSDIRGFTNKFDEDESNLEAMSLKTKKVLEDMYDNVKDNYGIHIQFQGDREFAVFCNVNNYNAAENAVIAGLRLIDSVEKQNISVGIGLSLGKMYATKIGARGNKDIIMLGKTINEASINEDTYAKERQIVISADVYEEIKDNNRLLSRLFSKEKDHYVTSVGYSSYCDQERIIQNNNDKRNNNYNGAWCNDKS